MASRCIGCGGPTTSGSKSGCCRSCFAVARNILGPKAKREDFQEFFRTNRGGDSETVKADLEGDTGTLTAVSSQPIDPQDLMKRANIDTSVWEVVKQNVGAWQSPNQEGTRTLYKANIELRRRYPVFVEQAVDAAVARLRKSSPKLPRLNHKRPEDPHLLLFSPNDAHFGKLCWSPETGENFDLKIASRVFNHALEQLVPLIPAANVEQILIPFGNDFLHFDTPHGETASGTPMDTDGRYVKVMNAAIDALVNAILFLVEQAPVHILYIPGNHDWISSWWVCRFLEAYFHNTPAVTFDSGPSPRKYHEYGINLLGFTHGNEEPHRDLPAIMATEQGGAWGRTSVHDIFVGHFHKRRSIRWTDVDTIIGPTLRILPSISARDAWHHKKGFVNPQRAADIYFYSRDRGYAGHVPASVPPEAYHG
jgi:hypothetical protein